MAFDQSSSKPGLQGMTSGQISSGLDLTYAPSTITTRQPTEGELDLLFEAMHDDYIGGQPSATPRTTPAAQAPPVLQTPTVTTTKTDTTPTPTNLSSPATNFPNTSHDVDELETQQQHAQQQENQAPLQPKLLLIIFQMLCSMGIRLLTHLLLHPQVLLNHHLPNMWIHQTCIRFINHTLMNINGLRITLWNK
ncbi:hypothetical protein Tco_1385608 [Tanacetum coccineum]